MEVNEPKSAFNCRFVVNRPRENQTEAVDFKVERVLEVLIRIGWNYALRLSLTRARVWRRRAMVFGEI